jgi:Ca2+-binding EF-hand superfamily protein
MKKQLALMALTLISVGSLQMPALADAWFDTWDHNHDGKWDYNEFRGANQEYWKAHHEKVVADRELRNAYNRMDADHDGFVTVENVRTYHNW